MLKDLMRRPRPISKLAELASGQDFRSDLSGNDEISKLATLATTPEFENEISNPAELALNYFKNNLLNYCAITTDQEHAAVAKAAKAANDRDQTAKAITTAKSAGAANFANLLKADCWVLHFADRDSQQVTVSPAMTFDEVMAINPSAIAAEPGQLPVVKPDRKLTTIELASIRAWASDIGEVDPGAIERLIHQCMTDVEAREQMFAVIATHNFSTASNKGSI